MRPIDLFYRAARMAPQALAVAGSVSKLAPDGKLSYAELEHHAQALAAALQKLGGKPRPVVALLTENSPEMLVAILAIYACQGVLVPLTSKYPAAEIHKQIATAQPDVIVASPKLAGVVRDLSTRVVWTAMSEDAREGDACLGDLLREWDGRVPAETAYDAADVAAIKFTGGSSGQPKAVLQSARCLVTMAVSMQQVFGLSDDDRFLLAPPMTHGAGTFVLPLLMAGGSLIIADGPKADVLLDLMQAHDATGTWVPPTLLYRMLDAQEAVPRSLPRLRHLLYGGAGIAPDRLAQAQSLFGPVVGVCYGQTEAPVIISGMAGAEAAQDHARGSVGRAAPLTRLAIMAADGALLPPGEEGEVVARGDLLMSGYLSMPDATRETLKDGWLHTGDLGYLSPQGYLFLKGRLKEVIISGGFNVYPSDVEAALSEHAAVAESCVFGLPDPLWGERVEAAVELKQEACATEEELIGFLKERIGAVRTPKRIHLFESLPRSALGKIQKRELREGLMSAAKRAG
ncbi:class I adenylate-forming enzyme family protein [Paracandidimonas soli]|uniref:Acyl-CoA synthetase (AMP-forming)/AMP-acid ligase II n=1 Tax=Paracandidimonas soli TaxID=1917182 RepID=A0A4R3USV0_9BURK|nr:AMP-binding protein [Paracandidimonas soli]TCU93880.1 acyl-CoA synthetase (AMP-forming)/AMP-acid ligase II [Paracandidimonas soli]